MTDRIQVYTPQSAREIADTFVEDFRLAALQQPGVDPVLVDQATRPNGDIRISSVAIGNALLVIHANVRINDNDTNVLTAEADALDEIRQAEGLPVVPAAPSTGSLELLLEIPQVPVNLQNGTEFVLPNGKRGKVVGNHPGLTVVAGKNPEVPVQTVDTGRDTRLPAGETVRWVSPPTNLKTEALISSDDPLTGGTDEETDAAKQARILSKRRNKPAGGNWSDKLAATLETGIPQFAFVYPALGGASSEKVVLVRENDPDNNSVSRELSSVAQDNVRAELHAAFPGQNELVVQSAADEIFDAAVLVTVPDAATAGGAGTGWLDNTPWPPPNAGGVPVTITVSGTLGIEVDSDDVPGPVNGQTHVTWWSSVDQKAYTRLVVLSSGVPGAWVLQFDSNFVDKNGDPPLVGEYIFPATVSGEQYGRKWIAAVNTLGPGENTADGYRLPRARRHPYPESGFTVTVNGVPRAFPSWPSDLTIQQLTTLQEGSVISDIEWMYRSKTTPTVPALVSDPPNVLVPRHFGIYKK